MSQEKLYKWDDVQKSYVLGLMGRDMSIEEIADAIKNSKEVLEKLKTNFFDDKITPPKFDWKMQLARFEDFHKTHKTGLSLETYIKARCIELWNNRVATLTDHYNDVYMYAPKIYCTNNNIAFTVRALHRNDHPFLIRCCWTKDACFETIAYFGDDFMKALFWGNLPIK